MDEQCEINKLILDSSNNKFIVNNYTKFSSK